MPPTGAMVYCTLGADWERRSAGLDGILCGWGVWSHEWEEWVRVAACSSVSGVPGRMAYSIGMVELGKAVIIARRENTVEISNPVTTALLKWFLS